MALCQNGEVDSYPPQYPRVTPPTIGIGKQHSAGLGLYDYGAAGTIPILAAFFFTGGLLPAVTYFLFTPQPPAAAPSRIPLRTFPTVMRRWTLFEGRPCARNFAPYASVSMNFPAAQQLSRGAGWLPAATFALVLGACDENIISRTECDRADSAVMVFEPRVY